MSRRLRAAGFATAAAVCAALAAAATGGTGDSTAEQLGDLREVVVAANGLPAGRELSRRMVERALELRRVPERFAPPDALTNPAQALGRAPATHIPPGGYVLDSQLAVPADTRGVRGGRLGTGRRPVEIAVSGAGALAPSAAGPAAGRVDVVVTTETGPGGGAGRTYVAARSVRLLDLVPAPGEPGSADPLAGPSTDSWIATLALTRGQALRLIQAESFARSVRLLGRG